LKKFRVPLLTFSCTSFLILALFGAQLRVPTVSATPSQASFNTSSPTANTCAGCHSGSPSSGGSTSISGFPSAMTYTPGGPAIPLTVTVTDPNFSNFGFQLTARLASNIATTGGTFTSTGGSASLGSNGSIQGSGSSTFTFNWTPPATASGSVNFYLTGLATSSLSNNAPYTAMYTLAAGAGTTTTPTISATPTSLSFAYTIGGATPAAKTISVASSGSALSFTTATSTTTGGSWLLATPASGSTTSGTVSVSVSPAGLTSGTYNGAVTTTSTGATGSPVTTKVTLVVSNSTVTTSTLTASPSTMSFAYTTGGATPAAQPILVSATPAALTYTVASTATWLSATPSSGTTPGSVNVSINPSGLTAATYTGTVTITSTGATGSPQSVLVTLVVSSPTSTSILKAAPTSFAFNFQSGGTNPPSQKLALTTTATTASYSATASGGSWLSITPSTGALPGTLTISANPAGMSAGTYSGAINLSSAGASGVNVPVTLVVTSATACTAPCGSTSAKVFAEPFILDASSSGTLAALWVTHLGVPTSAGANSGDLGLLLSKNGTAPARSQAGADLKNVQGSLTEIGFDYREGGQCTPTSPRFVVVTTDAVSHTVGGCSKGTSTAGPVVGWQRVRFNLADATQTAPAITPGEQLSSVTLVLDEGPESGAAAAGGLVVIDNIDINGTFAEKVFLGTSLGFRPIATFRDR